MRAFVFPVSVAQHGEQLAAGQVLSRNDFVHRRVQAFQTAGLILRLGVFQVVLRPENGPSGSDRATENLPEHGRLAFWIQLRVPLVEGDAQRFKLGV